MIITRARGISYKNTGVFVSSYRCSVDYQIPYCSSRDTSKQSCARGIAIRIIKNDMSVSVENSPEGVLRVTDSNLILNSGQVDIRAKGEVLVFVISKHI